VESRERQTKRQIRLFGGAILIILGADQVTQLHRWGGQAIFVGIMVLIAGAGLLYFGLFRT